MRTYRCVVLTFVVLMALRASAQPAKDDFKQTNEWKAMNRYVGSWDQQVTVTVPEPKQARYTEDAAWILGDRFLQNRSRSDTDKIEAIFLLTYDDKRRAVRCWSFSSNGQAGTSTASWDELTSTFTLTPDDVAPGSCTITDRFVDADHREGKVTFKDARGKVVYVALKTATRRKKPADKP